LVGLALVSVVIWQVVSAVGSGIDGLFGGAKVVTTRPLIRLRQTYRVAAGDTVSGIAARYGISVQALIGANRLKHPNAIVVGQTLVIPTARHPAVTRRLIRSAAARYHVDPAFALGLADEESGFNENAVSDTGAIGVMQIEPETGQFLAQELNRTINLGVERDNISAGVYWLSRLLADYHGSERSAAAAYYEGQGNLARHGYLPGTGLYVADVMALREKYLTHAGGS